MSAFFKIILFTVLIPFGVTAQAPSAFSYQAIVRNNSGEILSNKAIGLAISIIKKTPEGPILYRESHQTNSNANGLISTTIGHGSGQYGNIDTISWTDGPYYINTEIDPLGGNNYTLSGTTAMLSVPFALAAQQADTLIGNINYKQIIDLKCNNQQATGMLNAYDYGIKGDGSTDDTEAIIALLELANGKAVFFPPGEYIIDGTTITTEKIQLYGIYPQYIDSKLENGTIFRGKLSFTSKNVKIQNIGLDLHGLDADDGLRVTPTKDTGHFCDIQNIITVGSNLTDPYHSFLIEGFDHVNISNIEVRNAYMGVILKVKGGIVNNIRSYNMAREGLFLKSDNSFGNCKDLIVDKVYVENNVPGQSVGVKVLSDGAQFENLNLSNLFIRRAIYGISIICSGGNGIAINNLNIHNVKIDWPLVYSLYLEADKGFIYNTNINNVDVTNFSNLLTTKGTVKYLNLNNVNANAKSNIDLSYKEKIINIGANTKKTHLSNITLLLDYKENNDLAIWYQNSGEENRISNHNLRLRGGIPQSGMSTAPITGTGNSLSPTISNISPSSLITLIPDNANTEINEILPYPNAAFPSELFPIGYELVLRNNSNFDLTIKNNYAGKIVNPEQKDATLKAQSLITYVFSGSVWNKKE